MLPGEMSLVMRKMTVIIGKRWVILPVIWYLLTVFVQDKMVLIYDEKGCLCYKGSFFVSKNLHWEDCLYVRVKL